MLDDQVLGALYGAVDDATRWVGLMDMLRCQLRVESVAAQLLVPSQDKLLPVWGTRDSHSERHGQLHDSWANSPANPRFRRPASPLAEMEIGSDARCRDFSPRDRRKLTDGLAHCGLGPAFWMSQQLDSEHIFTLIFHRIRDDTRDMEAHDEQMLAMMAPHVRQAGRLWMRLAAAEMQAELAGQASDSMMAAVLACDHRLRVHWGNAQAHAMLKAGDLLRLRHGALVANGRADQEDLLALVEGRTDRAVLALGGADRSLLHIRAGAARLPVGFHAPSPDLVLLTITRPEAYVRYAPREIAQLFGLTMTEACLAANLAAGSTVSDFAAARGIAEGTARLHLKRVLAKTGTGRQSELVRRICRSVASGTIVL